MAPSVESAFLTVSAPLFVIDELSSDNRIAKAVRGQRITTAEKAEAGKGRSRIELVLCDIIPIKYSISRSVSARTLSVLSKSSIIKNPLTID